MKKAIFFCLVTTVVVCSCNNRNNQTGEGAKDTTKTIDTRRNTQGTTDFIYDTSNKGGDSTPNTGGTPTKP
ncbi:MAG: hypothetical protein JWP69_1559 [Flaviaesturariibacter sp.]|nr:hypothetical protein [Flaviaesturariibacter sp.]